ncbi:hypothetical protein POJ06DRAFT_36785 [Lipomyces tetrasporus]|uniref:Uncharacterized protein n=1 Tax=Lipomyces tetrasporus TaxID=54092 RepID=A0AAD7QKJ9_9ASCO|nr:uncharacterized protein POJ06DRAFT_36785 [Lipomyces tetrasporus]KAJ8096964.1 hypothetical protein POJ06DRAFT_36785 [Lipomyces tetrasporus]
MTRLTLLAYALILLVFSINRVEGVNIYFYSHYSCWYSRSLECTNVGMFACCRTNRNFRSVYYNGLTRGDILVSYKYANRSPCGQQKARIYASRATCLKSDIYYRGGAIWFNCASCIGVIHKRGLDNATTISNNTSMDDTLIDQVLADNVDCNNYTTPDVMNIDDRFAWIGGHGVPEAYKGNHRTYLSHEQTEAIIEELNDGMDESEVLENYSEYFAVKDDDYYKWKDAVSARR